MSSSNKKAFEIIISKTKIYIVIIAILLIVICFYNTHLIIPSIVVFILLIGYSIWSNSKRRTEISKHIQELTVNVDSAAKNSLINSPFPLVIVETDGNIIWKSSKFVSEFMNKDINNILDEKIKELKFQITEKISKKAKDKKVVTNLEVDNKIYEITGEYVKSKQKDKKNQTEYMMVLYFIDKTEYRNLITENENSKTCVGIIMIDNYEEIMQRIPPENKPQIIAELEKSIYDWANLSNGLIVKNERDTFVYVFRKEFVNKIEETKFNILDVVKDIDIEGRIQLTLSIAIGVDGNSLVEQYKNAKAAMDIALGRGGDQAVVLKDGKYNFFGGKAQELEKRTKVKARNIANALEQLITESEKVIIMGHKNPDIDAIGSSLGIFRVAKSLGKEAFIVSESYGMSISKFIDEIKLQDEYKGVLINKSEAMNIVNPNALLVVVDTHKIGLVELPELLNKTDKIVIIDHHRRATDYIENATLLFHEVYASSAAELVTEILQYTEKDVKITPLEAEGLYGGIMVDTKNFTFKTGVRTFEAAAYLRKCGIDIIKIKKWFQSDLESYNIISDIVKSAELIKDTIGIAVYNKEEKDVNLICAKAADELLTISDITASFVIGKIGEKVCISGRSVGDINVQVILEKLRRRRTYYSSWCTN